MPIQIIGQNSTLHRTGDGIGGVALLAMAQNCLIKFEWVVNLFKTMLFESRKKNGTGKNSRWGK